MHLQKLNLSYFRNHTDVKIEFSQDINVFLGPNGGGKTNILEAIHYLSLTKSVLIPSDAANITHDAPFFRIEGTLTKLNRQYIIACSYEKGKKKILKVNETPCEKFFDHIGQFPLVFMHPFDVDLIRDGSEARRKFIDLQLCQLNSSYIYTLSRYQKALKSRNILLKKFNNNKVIDWTQIDPFDKVLIEEGSKIGAWRNQWIQKFLPHLNAQYLAIGGSEEVIEMIYTTHATSKKEFNEQLKASREKDYHMARTHVGIHKDDLLLKINGHALKKYGSQGQQKSFLIALKLALLPQFYEKEGVYPMLLLDDIFDKLDDSRIQRLLKVIAYYKGLQVFITDARTERTTQFFKDFPKNVKTFNVPLLNGEK